MGRRKDLTQEKVYAPYTIVNIKHITIFHIILIDNVPHTIDKMEHSYGSGLPRVAVWYTGNNRPTYYDTTESVNTIPSLFNRDK